MFFIVEKTNNNLAQIIRSTRAKLHKTQEEFGKLFNPPAAKSIVSRWENGTSSPSNERLIAISKLSGFSVEELLYGTLENSIHDVMDMAFSIDFGKIPRTDFISQAKNFNQRTFFTNIYDFRSFFESSYFGTPRPKAWKIHDREWTDEEKKEVDDYYSKEFDRGVDLLTQSVLKIAQATDIKPYEKGMIARLLSEEAERVFTEQTRTKEGFFNMVLQDLSDLIEDKIWRMFHGIKMSGDHKEVRIDSEIDPDLETKVSKIIEEAYKKIENLSEYNNEND
ncbi:helix-turn-helix domain-containing protein [Ligilactobacillus acidipiscis]|uniref:helix-turn-helix domain-containing protein n=1 Tax=Ligilactobacillus acidipiscis TaxID=89059 RepID=UPI003866FFF9